MFNRLPEAPKKGKFYAVYIDKVVYEDCIDELLNEAETGFDNLLELHIFDENTEYRFVKTLGNDIECIISDELMKNEGCDDTYIESVYVSKDSPDKSDGFSDDDMVNVVNYIKYDENDMLRIINYRYSTGKDRAK